MCVCAAYAPAEPPTPPRLAPIPITASVLADLQASIAGGNSAPAAATRDLTATLAALSALRSEAGAEPGGALDRGSLRTQLAQAEAAIDTDAAWDDLMDEHRKLAIEWLAARLRYLQLERSLDADPTVGDRIDEAMRALTRRLGPKGSFPLFCHGLARGHTPHNRSWLHDARVHQKAIDKLTGKHARDRKKADTTAQQDDLFRRLRAASVRDDKPTVRALCRDLLGLGVSLDDARWRVPLETQLDDLGSRSVDRRDLKALVDAVGKALARETEDEERAGSDLPAAELRGWSLLARTRGKRLLIIGGDGRQERVPKICAAFGLLSVEWADLPKNAPRAKDSVVERIERGNFDFVVCLQRFVSHELTDAVWACDAPDVVRILARGYGIGQLQRGFERFLAG